MRILPAGCLLAIVFLTGCRCEHTSSAPTEFLERNRSRYTGARERARGWLDRLHVDPIELRSHGIKGTKKLVEQLDAYRRLYQSADPAEKPALMARIREVAAITYEPRFHNLLEVDDKTFKEDATSYLRCALLLERLGLDTRLYREEIRKVHPRLNGHMRSRGANQRMAFHWYYQHFGLEEPFPLENAFEGGVIASRKDPAQLSSMDTYALTHEVFVPFEFGDRLDVEPFGQADRSYLEKALAVLVPRSIEQQNADLAAELVACLRYLKFYELPAYLQGLEFLLAAQHEDGSWGNLARARRAFGPYAAQGEILHTTLVVLEALMSAFEPSMNPASRQSGLD